MPTIDLGKVVGDTGARGATGAAAGFGEVTATVNNTTGNPAVSVSTSGPDTAKSFNFSFSGLKGEPGKDGNDGEKGEKGDDGQLVGAENLISTFYPHAASGSEAVFRDAAAASVKDLTVKIEPVQELHGYDKPWPGGVGKNLLGITAESQTIYGVTFTVDKAAGTVTISGTATASFNVVLANKAELVNYLSPYYGQTFILTGCPAGGSVSTYRLNAVGLNGGEMASTDFGAGVSISTIDFSQIKDVFIAIRIDSGYTADNLVFRPMLRLASETDDTFEPYSNICPITGWTGTNVQRIGKNLLEITATTQTTNGVTFTVDKAAGTVTVNGTANAMTFFNLVKGSFSLTAGSYYLSSGGVGSPETAGLYANVAGSYYWTAPSNDYTAYIPISESAVQGVTIRVQSGYTANNLVFRPMICLASETDDTFEPYRNDSYSISWEAKAGIVYGGTLDVTTGVLTVTDANIASYDGEELPGEWISDRGVYPGELVYGSQVVYKLATPLTFQLTPTEVKTLLGYNRISADCGDVFVTYFADPLKSYEQKTEGGGEFAVSADSVFSGDGKSVADRLKAIEQAIVSLGGNI